MDTNFELYDLRIELVRFEGGKQVSYGAKIGDYFIVEGENIFFPKGQGFSFYNLAAIIPVLAAKQRINNKSDWIEIDDEIRAPDANCGAIFKITRTGKRTFSSENTSGNPKIHEK